MSSRYTYAAPQLPSAQRKSRVDGKVSLIPKPKLSRQGSYERLSETGWRPGRPRSLEPPRPSVSIGRPSREQSASKMHHNQRSRSGQQSESRPYMTPMSKSKASNIYSRVTATPMVTPSIDRSTRGWQNCLDRAIACVTVQDKRPISDAAWQKKTFVRINEELSRRAGASGGALLMKPLTIGRFVEITSSLLTCLMEKAKLDTVTYVTKLPNLTKRLLYPGAVSKSWLKTVNTLHTYPSALALIAYLLDLSVRVESPVDEEVIYSERGELNKLRREYEAECWRCFNEGDDDFSNLEDDYIRKVQDILGDDSQKKAQLLQTIQEYRQQLEDPAEQAAREDEQRRHDMLGQLAEAVRELRSKRIQDSGRIDAACHQQKQLIEADHQLHAENEKLLQEIEQVKKEVSSQQLSVTERAEILDKVDYSNRVIDSKNTLLQKLTKMLYKTESDLALSQKQCLEICVEFNQKIISLTSSHTDCAGLAVEERDLMSPATVARARESLQALDNKRAGLASALHRAERARAAEARRLSDNHYQLDQTAARLESMLKQLEQGKQELRAAREAWATEREAHARRVSEVTAAVESNNRRVAELALKEKELEEREDDDRFWQERLVELRQYVTEQEALAARRLDECKEKRTAALTSHVLAWTGKLRELNARYTKA